MKKKGFTLVELLAVIAILAILVIIALPNVLGMFNQAKKSTFVTECQSIYDTANKQFISDQMESMSEWSKGIAYARVQSNRISNNPDASGDNGYKFLDLSGTEKISYYIHFTLAGNVDRFVATDGQYQFIYLGSDLKKEKITATKIDATGSTEIANGDTLVAAFEIKDNTFSRTGTDEINTGVITISEAYAAKDLEWSEVKFEKSDTGLQVTSTKKTQGSGSSSEDDGD